MEELTRIINQIKEYKKNGLSKLSDDCILDCSVRIYHTNRIEESKRSKFTGPISSKGDGQGGLPSTGSSNPSSKPVHPNADTSSSSPPTSNGKFIPASSEQMKYGAKWNLGFTTKTSQREAWLAIKAHKEGKR